MKEKSDGVDSLLDVIQDRFGDVVGVALDKAHWVTKGQGTHHIIAVMDAYLVYQNGQPQILTDSNEELARELLDPGGIVRKRCNDISFQLQTRDLLPTYTS